MAPEHPFARCRSVARATRPEFKRFAGMSAWSPSPRLAEAVGAVAAVTELRSTSTPAHRPVARLRQPARRRLDRVRFQATRHHCRRLGTYRNSRADSRAAAAVAVRV